MMHYNVIKKQLEQKRDELVARLSALAFDATNEHTRDAPDQAQARENDEVVDEIGNRTRETIAEINTALTRLADGQYGICIRCHQPITPMRLAAKPEAVNCINCAN